jgi:preprotein translocase subunit SecD
LKRRGSSAFFLVILVIGLFVYLCFNGVPGIGITSVKDIRKGIDIKGGIGTTLYPDLPEGEKPTLKELETAKHIMMLRLDRRNIFDRNITIEQDKGRILLEIPYKQGENELDSQEAVDETMEEIGETALLTFQRVDEEKYEGYLPNGQKNYLPTGEIVVHGSQVEDAGVETNPQTGEVVVTLKLYTEGAKSFADATAELVGKKIAIFMDEQLITAPTVNDVITGGDAIITGQRDAKEAGDLAAKIRSGALPFRMVYKQFDRITPLLGEGALNVAINAGIVAFILVFIYMILRYRLPGLIANVALIGLISFELLIISWLGVTLTLPGIAGIILTIGMGVDANVIIFERIKEELKTGKTLRTSIDSGFRRAFKAILDANVTTMITAAVLYKLGSGPIKGFAATLFIGVILSFFTAVLASRIMLESISNVGVFKNKWLYGYGEVKAND